MKNLTPSKGQPKTPLILYFQNIQAIQLGLRLGLGLGLDLGLGLKLRLGFELTNEHKLWTPSGVGLIRPPPWRFIRLVYI